MDTFTLVRPEHLNHHGYLFGGQLLKWVDELAWLAASRDYRGVKFVTIGMEQIHFRHPVVNGSILRFRIDYRQHTTTSVTYAVDVFADAPGAEREIHVFDNLVTFVSIDDRGEKTPLPSRP